MRNAREGRHWRTAALRTATTLLSQGWQAVFRRGRPVAGGRNLIRPIELLELRCLLSAGPLITEFVAVNNTGLTDETGSHADWLELHNPGGSDLNLAGYYLTDDKNNLTKWQLPAVTLPSGGYLTVFADGADRRTVGSPLHTNFNLTGSGGYLGFVGTNGSTILSQYDYPQQVGDTSYGVQLDEQPTKLVPPGAPVRVLVPQDGSLGTTWKDPGFTDSGWTPGTTGVGYETEAAQPPSPGFSVRMVDTNGGTDGNISDIGKATAILDGTAT